jgi:ABC-type dipeptide/oligopeptide/nickel transport system permease subunit
MSCLNIMPTVIVLATLQLGTAIRAETTNSFLGIGVTNFPTWARCFPVAHVISPRAICTWRSSRGAAISLAVLGFNMLGDALRDVLDPRLRGS